MSRHVAARTHSHHQTTHAARKSARYSSRHDTCIAARRARREKHCARSQTTTPHRQHPVRHPMLQEGARDRHCLSLKTRHPQSPASGAPKMLATHEHCRQRKQNTCIIVQWELLRYTMAAGMATRIRPATPDSCLLVHTPATAEPKNRLHSSCPALACYLSRTSSHSMPLNSSGAASNRSCTGSRKLCRSRQQQQRPDPGQNTCMLRDHPHQS